jgi:light-regulated signal transduction histidine kinase (bacteriophytochrome)
LGDQRFGIDDYERFRCDIADRQGVIRVITKRITLSRSNEELSAFWHVVAHDLHTPLRAVKTYVELLVRHLEGRLDPISPQFISFVTQGAETMEKLIVSPLRYAESEDELSTSRVSVNALIYGLLERLEPLIREAGATVTTDLLPAVQADPVRLLQLFQNLIVNAVNYWSSEAPRVYLSAKPSGDEYRFALSDNDIGVAKISSAFSRP